MMLIGIGGVAIFIAREYLFGTAIKMGPGFFSIILGGSSSSTEVLFRSLSVGSATPSRR